MTPCNSEVTGWCMALHDMKHGPRGTLPLMPSSDCSQVSEDDRNISVTCLIQPVVLRAKGIEHRVLLRNKGKYIVQIISGIFLA